VCDQLIPHEPPQQPPRSHGGAPEESFDEQELPEDPPMEIMEAERRRL
jgi:hypothetical protein